MVHCDSLIKEQQHYLLSNGQQITSPQILLYLHEPPHFQQLFLTRTVQPLDRRGAHLSSPPPQHLERSTVHDPQLSDISPRVEHRPGYTQLFTRLLDTEALLVEVAHNSLVLFTDQVYVSEGAFETSSGGNEVA